MDDPDPLDGYGLRKILPAHKPLFDACFSMAEPQLSDYSFANTFIWQEPIHLRWQFSHGCLNVFANGEEGLSLLFPPMGEGDFRAALKDAMEICRAYNENTPTNPLPRVEYINDSLLAKFPEGCNVAPMSGDYVYPTRKIIDLDGGELHGRRKARSWFMRNYEVRTETYHSQIHRDTCLQLLGLWKEQADESPANVLSSVEIKRSKEVLATTCALSNAEMLGLKGMVLYADGRPIGFTLGEFLQGGKMCSILIEKTNREYRGSANYIFSEFCRQHWADTTWCNAGDDWELPSLAYTKTSYCPSHRLGKWVVWPPLPVQVSLAAAYESETQQRMDEETLAVGMTDYERAGLPDLNELLRLESNCFGGGDLFTRRQMRYLLKTPTATTFVIRKEGQMVAAATLLRKRCPKGFMSGRLYSMAVDPNHRKKGFGKMLIKACIKTLQEEGIPKLYLEVRSDNAPAIALYEAMGFNTIRVLRNYYGTGQHGLKMLMRLAPAGQEPAPKNTHEVQLTLFA